MKKKTGFCSDAKVPILLLFLMIIVPFSMSTRPFNHSQPDQTSNEHGPREDKEVIRRNDMGQFVAGSRLPDCSHACGSCMPCRLVIVGSACASLTEAESCPISYRCMCNNKTYPVP